MKLQLLMKMLNNCIYEAASYGISNSLAVFHALFILVYFPFCAICNSFVPLVCN